MLISSWVKVGLSVENVHEVDEDIIADFKFIAILNWFFFLEIFFQLLFLQRLFLLRIFSFIFYSFCVFGIDSAEDFIVKKKQKLYFLLVGKLDSFDFYEFVLIFFESNIDNASCAIKKAYKSLGQMKHDWFVVEGPSVVFKLLVFGFVIE